MKRILTLALLAMSAMLALAQDSLRVTIFGDSYSTFYGYIPSTHEPWYGPEGHWSYKGDRNDVHQVEQTWWYQVIERLGAKLEINNSWSGSTIGYFGYQQENYKPRSFNTRTPYLGEPDLILVCAGTNDSWTGEKVGDYKYGNFEDADFWYFRPAMASMIYKIKEHYPLAKVYFILNNELRADINESVHVICRHYGVPCIDLHDIDKQQGHPSAKGMKAFADQVFEVISKDLK